jgi:uncharacterized protein YutE (UPF0331/DUF86 family)
MDIEYINEKIIYIKSLLIKLDKLLNRHNKIEDEEEQEFSFAAMTKFVEEIIETSIKINNKLLEMNNDFAATYYQTFSKLTKYYPIDKENKEYFSNITSLRNKATHEYENLLSNKEEGIKKYEIICKKFPIYIKYIKTIVEKESNKNE